MSNILEVEDIAPYENVQHSGTDLGLEIDIPLDQEVTPCGSVGRPPFQHGLS